MNLFKTDITDNEQAFPSQDSVQIANNLSNLGQLYNRDDLETNVPVKFSLNNQLHVESYQD